MKYHLPMAESYFLLSKQTIQESASWAQYKKYKLSVISYFYIGLVLGCVDADLCK